jgi:peroxiredoxin
MRRHLVLVIVLSAAMLHGCGFGAPRSGPMEGQKLPDAELVALSGETLQVSDFAGRPVVLNFWATWCGPCKEEIPELQAAHEKYSGSEGLQIIGITDESSSDVQPFVEANGMTFSIAYDRSGQASSRYRVQAIPTTLFINAEGIVVTRHTGVLSEGRMRLYIERLLSNSSPGEPTAQPSTAPAQPAPTRAPAQPAPTIVPPPQTGGDDVGRRRADPI